MKQCGIYVIKNSINGLCYVGQSVDIMCRWYAHKQSAKNSRDLSHHTKIHQAMYNLGIDNFYIEVLEECDYDKLDEREIYWINKLGTYNNGYNMTLGGEGNKGETNGRAILTEQDVVEIRSAYNNHIQFKDVYDKYRNRISKRGLQKVWHFETWKHIMPEVYTDENRLWHATCAKAHEKGNIDLGLTNKLRACPEEEIQQMRELRAQGLSYEKISTILGRASSVVRKYCLFQESTNPDKTTGKEIRNIETKLVFSSYSEASKWACCDRHLISNNINTTLSAGTVPTTGMPAHWISL